MTHGSLFSGIGGFDLAAEWCGWTNVFQVEWDPFCQKVLKKNFPHANIYGDICEFDGRPYAGAIDVISGGFPCQPFSVAGKRKGQADDRHLWPQMLRVIREVGPAWVVGENVAGLVSMDGGRVFDEILADLEGAGYTVETFVIPACAVGAPHRRDRLWIVAHARNDGHRGESERGGLSSSTGKAEGKTQGPDGERVRAGHFNGAENRDATGVGSIGWKIARPDEVGKLGRERFAVNHWRTPWPEVATRLCGTFNGFSTWMDRNFVTSNYGTPDQKLTGQDLPHLWQYFQQEAFCQSAGGRNPLRYKDYLFSILWQRFAKAYRQDNLSFESAEVQAAYLRNVWYGSKSGCPPQGWRYNEQYGKKHSDALPLLSHEIALEAKEEIAAYGLDRAKRLKALGNSIVPQVVYQIFKAIDAA